MSPVSVFEIHLEQFEGPLDLLLHLIKKNEMDIYDIPIARITDQYLAVLDAMQSLNLDVAGEFLVMAATLLHIKSKTLLPSSPADDETEEDEEDPRAELVRRLLEYRKYKEAAEELECRPLLGRDLFARLENDPEMEREEGTEFEPIGLFELIEALQQVLAECPEENVHEVTLEQLSVTDRINSILGELNDRGTLMFRELFPPEPRRNDVVVTFLAMLELVRLRLVRLLQNAHYGTIWLSARDDEPSPAPDTHEDSLGYR